MTNRRETIVNTSDGLKPNFSAALNRHPSYLPLHDKEFEPKNHSGSTASDPINVLDDDDPDTAEVSFIDLENDNEVPNEENHTAPIKPAVAETHDLGFQSVIKSHSPCSNARARNPAKDIERVSQPLSRTLTMGDIPAPRVQSVQEDGGIGFKAWYKTHNAYRTGNAAPSAPAMRQKQISQIPSIPLFNEERPKNLTRRRRDVPQYTMSVLNSKRKRTNTNAEDASSAMDIDPAHGHENDRMPGENDSAVSLIAYESPNSKETLTGAGDEPSGSSVVRKSSPVSPYLSNEDHGYLLTTQCRENQSDGHMDAYGMDTTQTSAQDRDAQEQGDGINAAHSSNSASRKQKDRKPRVVGPTNVCGVFSSEEKPPVKRSKRGAFHCPRCDSQFTKSNGVNHHFEECVASYGNPKSLRWDDHLSLEGVVMRAGPASMIQDTNRMESRMSPAPEESTRNATVDGQRDSGRLAPSANMRALPLDSDTDASTISILPEFRPTIKDHTLSSIERTGLDHPRSPVAHRATAGKGLSQETFKIFQGTGHWNYGKGADQNADEAQDEETEMPNIAYHYFVQKREWLETEEDAKESGLGPYLTMTEANAVAKAEVQLPQIDGFEGIRSNGWSYIYQQDDNGMQTHLATVLGIHIETAVHRELAPHNQRAPIPKSAFVVAPRVYVVHELQWLPTSPDAMVKAPTHWQSLTHGVFTLLNKANQRASAEYLETPTGNWGNSEYDLLKKTEMKSDLDKKVRALNRDHDWFQEEIKLDDDGFSKVWVEAVVVEGPRN